MTKRIACLFLMMGAWISSAFAAPTVVYISFSGSDLNACTRAALCRTITHGLSVVASGGTVDIVGSGIYDTFTVTRSVTVTAEPGVVATINVPASGSGVTVNAGSTGVVALKGLRLAGSGSGNGIVVNTVSRITIENCDSRNFAGGLVFSLSIPATLKVAGGNFEGDNTSIFLCCNATPSPGINVAIDGAHVYGGHFAGINADGGHIVVTNTLLTGDPGCPSGNNVGILAVHGTTLAENNTVSGYCFGVLVNDTAFISANTITGNDTGVDLVFGSLFTRGNNTIENNTKNVSGTLTPYSPQ
jgi:hypothetical protein